MELCPGVNLNSARAVIATIRKKSKLSANLDRQTCRLKLRHHVISRQRLARRKSSAASPARAIGACPIGGRQLLS
jgi:hypothetical protein